MSTSHDSRVVLVDGELVVMFPYIPDQVAEIKQVPGAKWDKLAKVWRVPLTSLDDTIAFARRHRFRIHKDILALKIPPRPDQAAIDVDGDLIRLRFPYDPVMTRAARDAGLTFTARTKDWTIPSSSATTAVTFADAWRIPVPDDLRTLADTQAAEHARRAAASRAVDADLDVPTLACELRSYQRAGVAYALETRRCMIADQAGTGKTGQSLATLEAADAFPALVICPATLKLNWVNEVAKWIPHRTATMVAGRKPSDVPTTDLVVANYDILTGWLDPFIAHRFNAIVFDESQYVKSYDAKRTKAAVKLSKSLDRDVIRLCLTGTPITNKPAEFAAQFEILRRLDEFGGKMPFLTRYAEAFRDKWGHWHFDGAAHLEELHAKARASFYLRRTKDQVMTELPPVVHAPLVVDGDPKAMTEYRRAEADIIAFLAERAAEIARELGKSPKSAAVAARMRAESNEHLVRLSVLRRLAAQAKIAAVDEFITNRVDAGMKVVVAAHHRDVVDAIADRWGGLKIQGGMSPADVEAAKTRFQGDPDASVITLSIQAAKTGHTLTAASDVLFVELPWTPADVEQTYSRCHRMGQRDSVTATYLLVADTVDVEIHRLLTEKQAVVDAATDGVTVESTGSVGAELVARFAQRALI